MRIFLLVFVALALFHCSSSQLVFGPNGIRPPTINLMSIFRFLRKGFNNFMSTFEGSESGTIENAARSGIGGETTESPTSSTSSKQNLTLLDMNTMMDKLVEKLNLTCQEEYCQNMTSADLLTNSNVTIDVEEMSKIIENRSDEALESKVPSFLPVPLRSSGWLKSYLGLNIALLTLYLILSFPYYVTGVTVQDKLTEFNSLENLSDEFVTDSSILDELDQRVDFLKDDYMGYTSYGPNDMMMNYILDSGDQNDIEREGKSNGRKSLLMEEREDWKQNKEENECFEQMMCLKPGLGRALPVTHLGLKIMEWIPGLQSVVNKMNKRLTRLDEAVESGRQLSCHQYKCNRKK